MPQEILKETSQRTEAFYQMLHANPLVFIPNSTFAKAIWPHNTLDRTLEIQISQIIGLVRSQHMGGNGSGSLLTIDSSHGYMYVPSGFGKDFVIPEGFRANFVGGNHAFQDDVNRVIQELRTVDIVNPQLGQPRATASVYEDFIFFESRFSQRILPEDYERAFNVYSLERLYTRVGDLRDFLETVDGCQIHIESNRGGPGYRMYGGES